MSSLVLKQGQNKMGHKRNLLYPGNCKLASGLSTCCRPDCWPPAGMPPLQFSDTVNALDAGWLYLPQLLASCGLFHSNSCIGVSSFLFPIYFWDNPSTVPFCKDYTWNRENNSAFHCQPQHMQDCLNPFRLLQQKYYKLGTLWTTNIYFL